MKLDFYQDQTALQFFLTSTRPANEKRPPLFPSLIFFFGVRFIVVFLVEIVVEVTIVHVDFEDVVLFFVGWAQIDVVEFR